MLWLCVGRAVACEVECEASLPSGTIWVTDMRFLLLKLSGQSTCLEVGRKLSRFEVLVVIARFGVGSTRVLLNLLARMFALRARLTERGLSHCDRLKLSPVCRLLAGAL